MRLRFAPTWVHSLGIALVAIAVAGCNGQAEGERCDTWAANSGASDCQSGLVCKTGLGGLIGSHYGLCCPSDLTQATTSACSVNSGNMTTNTAPPEAGSGAATSDASDGAATSEASAEAAASDASGE